MTLLCGRGRRRLTRVYMRLRLACGSGWCVIAASLSPAGLRLRLTREAAIRSAPVATRRDSPSGSLAFPPPQPCPLVRDLVAAVSVAQPSPPQPCPSWPIPCPAMRPGCLPASSDSPRRPHRPRPRPRPPPAAAGRSSPSSGRLQGGKVTPINLAPQSRPGLHGHDKALLGTSDAWRCFVPHATPETRSRPVNSTLAVRLATLHATHPW